MEFRFRLERILPLVRETLGSLSDAEIAYLVAIVINRMGFCTQPHLVNGVSLSLANSRLIEELSNHHQIQSAVYELARLSVAKFPFDTQWELSYSVFGDSLAIRTI